ncbi:helix-turn-helix domain-containing protein [Bradyrhizobium sp. ISRA443]|uniref:helix-turn-helix domain-containing protein n=1 Tax=unclassified Bradyrhizobium TaxID=2631580 RepID=UPI0032AF4BFD
MRPVTPKGREAMVQSVVEGGLSKAAAARQFNVTPKTVAKWVKRFRAEGVDGLRDRSSRPHSLPSQAPAAARAAVEALRRQRYTGKQIAAEVGISPATVSRILHRLGLNRLRRRAKRPPRRWPHYCLSRKRLLLCVRFRTPCRATVTSRQRRLPATGEPFFEADQKLNTLECRWHGRCN